MSDIISEGRGLVDFFGSSSVDGVVFFCQILAMPPDGGEDDEAMLDLAMALNMQPEDIRNDASSVGVASIQPQVGEESSDSNTDAEGVSDDEISNAPTETSALRPQSPTEPPGSNQGSDEGSGMSSLAGDVVTTVNQGTDPAENPLNTGAQNDSSSPGKKAGGGGNVELNLFNIYTLILFFENTGSIILENLSNFEFSGVMKTQKIPIMWAHFLTVEYSGNSTLSSCTSVWICYLKSPRKASEEKQLRSINQAINQSINESIVRLPNASR